MRQKEQSYLIRNAKDSISGVLDETIIWFVIGAGERENNGGALKVPLASNNQRPGLAIEISIQQIYFIFRSVHHANTIMNIIGTESGIFPEAIIFYLMAATLGI